MTEGWDALEEDPRQKVRDAWPGAVLLDEEIIYYAEHHDLIKPFTRVNLKPARYQLTLGGEAKVGGKVCKIDKDHPLVIPPHQVAIVRSEEIIRMPRFLIGRWNLTVDRVYEGLLWTGALQVDPGWVGYLPCPLYNLSNQEIRIEAGERAFSIDFVRTTRFRPGVNRRYTDTIRQPTRVNPPINSYDTHNLHSGPYEALDQLKGLNRFRDLGVAAIALMFAILGIMVAALAVIATGPVTTADGPLEINPMVLLALSAAALGSSLLTWLIMLCCWLKRRI